jgi:hypothetical protein
VVDLSKTKEADPSDPNVVWMYKSIQAKAISVTLATDGENKINIIEQSPIGAQASLCLSPPFLLFHFADEIKIQS